MIVKCIISRLWTNISNDGLADIMQQCRQAQPQGLVGYSVNGAQRMLPNVISVVSVLNAAVHADQFRRGDFQQSLL